MPAPEEPYSAMTAAERAAAARAPLEAYNNNLTQVDELDRDEKGTANDLQRYRTDEDGFASKADLATYNRRWTWIFILSLLLLVPIDAAFLLKGLGQVLAESWFDSDSNWIVFGTATGVSLLLWVLTMKGVKLLTDARQQRARLSQPDCTEPLEVRRLHRIIRWKTAGRIAYVVALAVGLFVAHDSIKKRLESKESIQNEVGTSTGADVSVLLDQLSASGDAAAIAPRSAEITPLASTVSTGAEAFMLALLWALHGMMMVVFPSFAMANPVGERPFNRVVAEKKLSALEAQKSVSVRGLWDRLQALPADQRQDRVDNMPIRIAEIINKEFGRPLVRIEGAPSAPPNEAPQPPQDPPNDAAPDGPATRPPVPPVRVAEPEVPAPDPMRGVV